MSILSRLNPFAKKDDEPEAQKSTLSPEDLNSLMVGGGSSDSSARVTAKTAMQFSTVYACIKVLAESVGQLPLKVYQRTAEGREYLGDSDLQKLLRKPNPRQTGQEFFEMAVMLLKLKGN